MYVFKCILQCCILIFLEKKMIKIVIETCSCFIDRAVWFINSPQIHSSNPWHFDLTINSSYKNRVEEFLKNKFIKEVRTTKTRLNVYEVLLKITIVKSCADCFKFQVSLSILEENSVLDSLNCRFVTSDIFTFSDNFNSDIFTGNSQFVVENYFYSQEQKELLFADEEIDLKRQPLHKSCFVCLQKNVISFFVQHVKELITIFLKKNYMYFLEFIKMSEFMTRAIVRKKYLVWYGHDNVAKVVEFRTFDCFLDSVLHFKKNMMVLTKN